MTFVTTCLCNSVNYFIIHYSVAFPLSFAHFIIKDRNGNKIISVRFYQFLIQLAHAQSEQNSEHEELKEKI